MDPKTIKIGMLVEAKVLHTRNKEEGEELWVDALIIDQNTESNTVNLLVLDAEENNVFPLAYEVQLQDIRMNKFKTLKVENKTKYKIMKKKVSV